jgi:hypothetical protein
MSPGIPLLAVAALAAAGLPGMSEPPVETRICATLDEAVPPGSGPVLLVFFSIECAVCYEELFESRYLVDKGGWPVSVVGVSLAICEDLEAFLEKHAWIWPVVLDRRKTLFRKFGVDAVPDRVLLLGKETVYRDDAGLGLEPRRMELRRCLTRIFSR